MVAETGVSVERFRAICPIPRQQGERLAGARGWQRVPPVGGIEAAKSCTDAGAKSHREWAIVQTVAIALGAHGCGPVPCRMYALSGRRLPIAPIFLTRVPSCGQGCRSLGRPENREGGLPADARTMRAVFRQGWLPSFLADRCYRVAWWSIWARKSHRPELSRIFRRMPAFPNRHGAGSPTADWLSIQNGISLRKRKSWLGAERMKKTATAPRTTDGPTAAADCFGPARRRRA